MAQTGDTQRADAAASGSEARPLRVLHVEDSEDDALLVSRELRRGGYTVHCERVQTAETMAAALAQQGWDIVLSDHDMPTFSAPAALQVLQHSGRDIPFIVVTGAIGEEFAAGLMKAGAHDFIKKGNLARLVPAIERELREAESRREHRQAQEALRESEARLQLAVDGSDIGLWEFDIRTGHSRYSAVWRRLFGYDGGELNGSLDEWRCLVHPDDCERLDAFVESHLRAAPIAPYATEFRIRHKNGSYRWVFSRARVLVGDAGRPYRMLGTHVDITERKQAEQALQDSEARYRSLVENLNDTVFTVDALGQFTYVSPAMERTFGYSPADLLHRHFSDFVHPSDLPIVLGSMARTAAGQIDPLEFRVFDKAGAVRFVRTSSRALRDHGELMGFSGVITDITERKDAEAALRVSEQRFATAFHASPAPMSLARHEDGVIVDVNDSFLALTGYTREELIGEPAAVVGVVEESDRLARKALLAKGPIRDIEVKLRTKSGREVVVLASLELLDLNGVKCNLGIAVDITSRKRAEEALRARAEQYRQLVERSPEAIAVDRDGAIAFVNSAAVKLLGATSAAELLGRPIMSFVHPDFHALVAEHMSGLAAEPNIPRRAYEKLIRLDGTVINVEVAASAITYEGQPAVQVVVHDMNACTCAAAALAGAIRGDDCAG